MGFKSIMKKVGKAALKVAPYAAYAIPGVGPLAGMAIQAGLSAANAKVSGGSWKQAGLAGAMGAGTSYIGGKIPGLGEVTKGVGPSSKIAQEAGKKLTKTAIAKGIAKQTVANVLTGNKSSTPSAIPTDMRGAIKDRVVGMAMNRMGGAGSSGSSSSANARTSQPNQSGTARSASGPLNNQAASVYGPSNPSMADAIYQGRQQSINNQPFRSGYNMQTGYNDETEQPIYTAMPPIQSQNTNYADINSGGILNKRARARAAAGI